MKLHAATGMTATTFALLAATTAFAAAQSSAPASIPPEHRAGEVTYVSGGIGHDEALAMKRAARDYPLEVVFVQKSGTHQQYLADMPVVIKDAHGKVVFEGRSEGPYFLARLPEGRYRVSTHWNSWSFSRPVNVGAKPQSVVFEWKQAPSKSSS